MRGIISRFAPAPTGYLHLGHVVNAALVWRETRAASTGSAPSGKVLLRIEDHDRQRSRPEFEAAIRQNSGLIAEQILAGSPERDADGEEPAED